MLTAICPNEVSETNSPAQNEMVGQDVQLTDAEILRRVRNIKSTWTTAERAARRREADRRLENLIDTLFAEAA